MSSWEREKLSSMDERMIAVARDLSAQRDCFVQQTVTLAKLHNTAVQYLAKQHELSTTEVLQAIDRLAVQNSSERAEDQMKAKLKGWRSLRDTLIFPTMHDRQENIEPSHPSTHEWIFQADMAQGQDLEWDPFGDWARRSDEVYWISGRAASGKSTLMSFLLGHDYTRSVLREWAADSSLLTASFFFYAEGSQMQRSRVGFLRTILYKLLCFKETEELIPTVLGPYVHDIDSETSFGSVSWTETALQTALDRILQQKPVKFKICLFIDALDEFEGDDLETVLSLLRKTVSHNNVKACLSSRPWLVFQHAFHKKPQLRLEELTERDMAKYVGDRLLTLDRLQYLDKIEQRQMESLIAAMVQQADGVFLWLKLAVPSLLRGFGTEDEIEVLEERLKLLPKGLSGMYAHMLKNVEIVHYARASRYFHLCLAADVAPSVLTLALAERLEIDSVLAQDLQYQEVDTFVADVRRTSKRVYSHGAGLLEIDALPLNRDPLHVRTMFACGFGSIEESLQTMHRARVAPLHRTVREFMSDSSNDAAKQLLARTDLTQFEPQIQLLAATVMQARRCTAQKHLLFRLVVDVVKYAKSTSDASSQRVCVLLDELDETMSTKQEHYETNEVLKHVHWSNAFYLSRPYSGPPMLPSLVNESFLDFALSCGLTTYVTIKIDQMAPAALQARKQQLLQHAIKSADELFCPFLTVMPPPEPAIVKRALECGGDPNGSIDGSDLSIWQFWIGRVGWGSVRSEEDFPLIMELMLSHGADPNTTLQRSSRSDPMTPLEVADSRSGTLSKQLGDEMTDVLERYGAQRLATAEADAAGGSLEVQVS